MNGPTPELSTQLAHELKGPLLALELQLRKLIQMDGENELLDSCLEQVEVLKQLVTRFLLLGASPSQPDAYRLSTVFARLERRFGPSAARAGIALYFLPTEIEPLGDASATEQALGNLVDNAIKFSPRGSRVTVEADAAESTIAIAVRDEGRGIAKDDLARVMEPFYRASRETRGTGLGLAIASAFAKAQGGSITIETREGEGSVFTLLLPSG